MSVNKLNLVGNNVEDIDALAETLYFLQTKFCSGVEDEYKVLIQCPVDVYVYDEQGMLVGSVVDNKVDSRIYDSVRIDLGGEGNDEKTVYLSNDEKYSVKLVGGAEGSMDVTLSAAEVSKTESCKWSNIPLEPAKEMWLDVEFGKIVKHEYPEIVIVEEGVITQKTETVDESKVSYTVNLYECLEDAEGKVSISSEAGSVKGGSYAPGTALCDLININSGYQLEGFYVDASCNEKYTQEVTPSEEITLYVKFKEKQKNGVIAQGSCKDGLVWELDENYQLTISGDGTMDLYNSPEETPWSEYMDVINAIFVEEGVKDISANAFAGCGVLEEVKISSGIKKIGTYAFYNCIGLKDIYFDGTKEQWEAIDIADQGGSFLSDANMHYAISDPVIPQQLQGRVSIEGKLQYKENLKAVVNLTSENAGDISYQWYREDEMIAGATEETYMLKADDVGQTIALKVMAANCSGTLEAVTGIVSKADMAPGAPKNRMEVPYNVDMISEISLQDFPGWKWAENSAALGLTIGNPITAVAEYCGDDSGYYETVSVNVEIIRLACKHSDESRCEVRNVKEATCVEKGFTGDLYCTICKEKISDGREIAATGHDWNEGKVTVEATCTEPGSRTYTCIKCGESKTETIPVKNVPEKNQFITDTVTQAIYKVTKQGLEVQYTASLNKKTVSAIIPDIVTIDGITYKVTSLANNAFKNNSKLATVVIGKNVTVIGNSAFQNCTSLKKVVIPSKVIKIGSKAFYGCKKLTSIIIKTTKLKTKTLGSKVFTKAGSKNYKKLNVKVPKKKLKSYKILLRRKGLSSKAKVKK